MPRCRPPRRRRLAHPMSAWAFAAADGRPRRPARRGLRRTAERAAPRRLAGPPHRLAGEAPASRPAARRSLPRGADRPCDLRRRRRGGRGDHAAVDASARWRRCRSAALALKVAFSLRGLVAAAGRIVQRALASDTEAARAGLLALVSREPRSGATADRLGDGRVAGREPHRQRGRAASSTSPSSACRVRSSTARSTRWTR